MEQFMSEDFLLSGETAKTLYHEFASPMPIIDYHCHINPRDIAEDKHFQNITQAFLYGDHYKWRLMRINGTDERYITGDASDLEKFEAWAAALPYAPGNPLYHWTHLELKRYFDYGGVLSPRTAHEVWGHCNQRLPNLGARDIIKRSNVRIICTTDDPADSLEYHKSLAEDTSFDVRVLPAWRPDRVLNIENAGFPEYVARLSETCGAAIGSLEDLFEALTVRMDHFGEHGCVASDHALCAVECLPADLEAVDRIFRKAIINKGGGSSTDTFDTVDTFDASRYKYALMEFFASQYKKRGWVMELHYGAERSVNRRMSLSLGPDTGFDCISGVPAGLGLTAFLSALNDKDILPKTVIFSLNPNDNLMINTVAGCFQSSGRRAKIQQGSAWWFNDTKTGMAAQMTDLANVGMLGGFIGMLTDSRSLLSYARHEYFRRILCDLLGGWVDNGEYPPDMDMLRELTEGICYWNAADYFGFQDSI